MTNFIPIVLFTGVQRLARGMRHRGLESACLVEPGESIHSPEEVDHWIPYDPADLSALGHWVRNWHLRHRVVAVINRREKRVQEHGLLVSALGLPGITPQQASILRDKLLLRQEIERHCPDLNPRFAKADLGALDPPAISMPFVLKPRNLFKSQLITLCETIGDWRRARERLPGLIRPTGRRHGVEIAKDFLAEEFVAGAEISVDAMIYQDGQFMFTPPVTLVPARHWGMEDFHVAVRVLPSSLKPREEAAVREAVSRMASALGLRSIPIHVDLVVTDGRVVILDVGPRVGGYRSEMMELAFGTPLDPLTLELAMGRRPEWRPKWARAVAVVELFPKTQGRLESISGLDRVKGLRSFCRFRQRTPLGEEVGLARCGYRCPLFVILTHDDPDVVSEEVELLRNLVDFQVGSS